MSVWDTIAGAFFGSLVAAGIVAYFTQKWIERRERRNRRDDLRLQLYLDVVDLILDNEHALAEADVRGSTAPVELQKKRLSISHRLKLIGSPEVNKAYQTYRMLVFQETTHPIEARSENADAVVDSRDALITLMVKDIQEL